MVSRVSRLRFRVSVRVRLGLRVKFRINIRAIID